MIREFKIIQSSPPHTGSTLLLNLIMANSDFNKKIAYHGGLFIFLTSGIIDSLKAILDNKFGLSNKSKQILIPS